jgi:hypothetical protein
MLVWVCLEIVLILIGAWFVPNVEHTTGLEIVLYTPDGTHR